LSIADKIFVMGPQWVQAGAHEPLKEHATYAACQVPSQSKFIVINRQLLLISFHIWKIFYLIIEIVSELSENC